MVQHSLRLGGRKQTVMLLDKFNITHSDISFNTILFELDTQTCISWYNICWPSCLLSRILWYSLLQTNRLRITFWFVWDFVDLLLRISMWTNSLSLSSSTIGIVSFHYISHHHWIINLTSPIHLYHQWRLSLFVNTPHLHNSSLPFIQKTLESRYTKYSKRQKNLSEAANLGCERKNNTAAKLLLLDRKPHCKL